MYYKGLCIISFSFGDLSSKHLNLLFCLDLLFVRFNHLQIRHVLWTLWSVLRTLRSLLWSLHTMLRTLLCPLLHSMLLALLYTFLQSLLQSLLWRLLVLKGAVTCNQSLPLP
ncbi:hypothetical protein KR200_006110 [Drosophila serrata]|nr:hypothetical protein KR200_006110 [Drosophila serrata]